jgi:hypothetical protein
MHYIKLEKNVHDNLPFGDLAAPEGFHILYYGFGATLFAMNTLSLEQNGEVIDPFYINRLGNLAALTDQDWAICPIEHELRNLMDSPAALAVFHQMQEFISPGTKTMPQWDMRYAPPLYISQSTDKFDCSYQRQPMTTKILEMSCQVFFNRQEQTFIFKDENCYQAFLKRIITTPNLAEIINLAEKSKKKLKHPDVTKLLFILRNMIKMRLIGWTIHQKDLDTINTLQKNHPELSAHIEKTLIDRPDKFQFIKELKIEISHNATIWDCFFKPLATDQIRYIRYQPSMKGAELVEAIQYLESKPLLSDKQKREIALEFFDEIFTDKNRNQEEKFLLAQNFSNTYPHVTIMKKWIKNEEHKKNESHTTQISPISSPKNIARQIQYKKTDFDIRNKSGQPEFQSMVDIENILNYTSFPLFIKKHDKSVQRAIFTVLGLIPLTILQGYLEETYKENPFLRSILMGAAFLTGLIILNFISRSLFLITQTGALAEIKCTTGWDCIDHQLRNKNIHEEYSLLPSLANNLGTSFRYHVNYRSIRPIIQKNEFQKINIHNLFFMLSLMTLDDQDDTAVIDFLFRLKFESNFTTRQLLMKTNLEEQINNQVREQNRNGYLFQLDMYFKIIINHTNSGEKINYHLLETFEKYMSTLLKLIVMKTNPIPSHKPLRPLYDFIIEERQSRQKKPDSMLQLYNNPWSIFRQNDNALESLAKNLSPEGDQSPNIGYAKEKLI